MSLSPPKHTTPTHRAVPRPALPAGPAEPATAGSGMPRFLAQAAPALVLQRDGDEATPDAPSGPPPPAARPGLLHPRSPYDGLHLGLGLQLQLDPLLLSQFQLQLQTSLDPAHWVPSLTLPVPPDGGPPGAGDAAPGAAGLGGSGSLGAPSGTAPSTDPPPTGTPPAPVAAATPPGSTPGPRPGTVGDVFGALTALPEVSLLLQDVESRALADAQQLWEGSSTPERMGIVSGSVVLGTSILAPLLAFDASRNTLLPLLNGRVIPLPGLPGSGVEFRFGEHDVMFGLHLDLGRYLPTVLGFGAGEAVPLGGPPGAEAAVPPVQRQAAPGSTPGGAAAPTAGPGLGQRISEARNSGMPLPPAVRGRFEHRSGADLSAVRVHTDSRADHLAREARARAFTTGRDIFFRAGAFNPASAGGARLLAHELTHTLQQASGHGPPVPPAGGLSISQPGDPHEREADQAADAMLRGQVPHIGTGAPPAQLQRQDDPPAGDPAPAVADFPDERALALLRGDGFDALYMAELLGGLAAMERNQPQAYAIVRQRLDRRFGAAVMSGIYDHDADIVRLAGHSEQITSRLQAACSHYFDTDQMTAYDVAYDYGESYEWTYGGIVSAYATRGEGVLAVLALMIGGDPDEIADALIAEADAAQAGQMALERQRAEWAEAGEEAVGSAIATREVLFWWDDEVTLSALLAPEYGFETQAEAVSWATTTGLACAVMRTGERDYVYQLSESYSFDDVRSTGLERRTDVVRTAGASRAVLTTTDGVVLSARDSRFFARDQTARADEHLAADLSLIETHGEDMGSDQAFRLFKQAARNLVFSNLEQSRRRLATEQDRFFMMPGLPVMLNLNPPAGEELQRDTAALRRHLMHATTLADAIGDNPTDAERGQIEEVLSAIGAIHERNPTAGLMVTTHRDEDATGPAEEDDFEDTVAGRRSGDAAMAGAAELGRRMANIERIEQHLLEEPDAVLSLTVVHPAVLSRFSASQQTGIQLNLMLHTMQEFAEAVGIAALDIGLLVTGTLIGGPVGLVLGGVSTAIGVGQTVEAFENVSLLESMTEVGFDSAEALITPEMVSSARTWAWIGAGLTLLDVGGFVRSASQMARLRSVLSNPELAHLLQHTRGSLGEAAEAMGTSEAALVRRLAGARGAERTSLLREIREALESSSSGGRYGYFNDWPDTYTPTVLNRMRQALLDDAGDVGRIGAAMDAFGESIPPDMLQQIKRYNFDSPGIAFSRENYEAWHRLASGRGTVFDARYLVHEARELRGFQRAGFEFMPANWASMGRHARTRWHRAFTAAYTRAHGEALAEEFNFMATQVSRATGGRVSLPGEVLAAIDGSFSGRNAREYMRVGDYVLADHPSFYTWASRAGETVALDAATRTRMGPALHDAVLRASGSTRAAQVAAGADPTLQELVAIVKRLPM
jgi:hypothetical protein